MGRLPASHAGEQVGLACAPGVVQPPLSRPPGDPRTGRHRVLACTARAGSCEGLALLLSLNKSSELGWPGAPWPPREPPLPGSCLPGKRQSCTVGEVLELCGCSQDTGITSYGSRAGWIFTDACSQSSRDPV